MKTYDLIVIGAGPAGISMAAEAVSGGISKEKVLIIEKAQEHSWIIRKYYPEEKLVTANYKGRDAVCSGVLCLSDSSKKETLSLLDQTIRDFGLQVNYQEEVQALKKESDHFILSTNKGTYESRVVVVAVGVMGRPNKPDYEIPSEIKSKIFFDISSPQLEGSSVLVVGGGDSASEYAQYLVQKGAWVDFSYRGAEFKRMNPINRESLMELGKQGRVELFLETNIEKLTANREKVFVTFKDRSDLNRSYDFIIYALGGSTPENFMSLLGIEFEGGKPRLTEGLETSVPGLFLVGDLSAGRSGGSIISAFNSSHVAMAKICKSYLECNR